MKPVQKVIKYLAIAFAIFLIVNIFSAILFGIYIFADVLGLTKTEQISGEQIITDFDNKEISTLSVNLEYSNLIIKNGAVLKAESNSKDITCIQNNNQLVIEQENQKWFSRDNKSQIIIYIPANIIFDKVYIKTGAGKIEIENLVAKDLNLEMGAGKVEVKNLSVLEKAKIEGGIGKVDILDGEISNLDLSIGIGKFEITTKLNGKNNINAGIGKLNVNLKDKIENYTIDVDKGIGSISIDGKSVPDDTRYGNGDKNIELEGGIGSIYIND